MNVVDRIRRRTVLSYANLRLAKTVVFYLLIALVLVGVLFPVMVMFLTSITPLNELLSPSLNLIPDNPTLDTYNQLWSETLIPTYYTNSILIAIGVVVVNTSLATLGGYGLATIDIPYKKVFARSILFGYMFPPILLAIPMFIFWRQLDLIDTYAGVILGESAVALPFSLWLMWQFFQTVPDSLEESAQMSGANRFRAFYEISLPMAKPGVVAVALFSFAASWNAFTIPKVIMITREKWPLTIGIHTLTEQFSVLWHQVMAASFLVVIPALLFVFLLQKYLLRGFRIGSVG